MIFEPWTIDPDIILETGVDPNTCTPEHLPGKPFGRRRTCTWAGNWYLLTLSATTHTLADLTHHQHTTPVHLPGRNAHAYLDHDNGEITFPTSGGAIIIRVTTRLSATTREDPRTTALRAAQILNRYLPG